MNLTILFCLIFMTLFVHIYAENKTTTTTKYSLPTTLKPYPPKGCQLIKCKPGYKCGCIPKCPRTCASKGYCIPDLPLYSSCKLSCICDDDHVLDDNYRCINKSLCHQLTTTTTTTLSPECASLQCPRGTECGCPPLSPPTCDNLYPQKSIPADNCTVQCYGVCRQGYVLDKLGGKCIPLGDCPGFCIRKHNYEKWYECSTKKCERTCDTPDPICTKECQTPGNFDCMPGYVRHVPTNRCVTLQQCKQKYIPCLRNEIWFPHSTIKYERTCKRPNPYFVATYDTPCNCDCRPPLVRDTMTCRCVRPNEPYCKRQMLREFWYELLK